MRRAPAGWFVALVLAACGGCQRPIVYVPGPVEQPPPPPPDPHPLPPPQPPPTPHPPLPTTASELLGRLSLGMTLAEATAAVGSEPKMVPASDAAPATARWFVGPDEDRWMVFATIVGGKVAGKGVAKVEIVR